MLTLHTDPGARNATTGAPRLLDLRAAAAYVGSSPATFRSEVAVGIWPPPLPLARLSGRRKRLVWDARALDARIDALSGAAGAANDNGNDDGFDLDWEMGLA